MKKNLIHNHDPRPYTNVRVHSIYRYVRRKLKGTTPDPADSETAAQPDNAEGDASLMDNANEETESSFHTPEDQEMETLVVNDEVNGDVVLLSSSVDELG